MLVVGPAGLYREGAYVALSRARHSAQLYATTQQATDVEQHRHGIRLPTEAEPDPEQELIDRLNVTAAAKKVLRSSLDHVTKSRFSGDGGRVPPQRRCEVPAQAAPCSASAFRKTT